MVGAAAERERDLSGEGGGGSRRGRHVVVGLATEEEETLGGETAREEE